MVESAFASLAGTGVVGVVLVLALLALRKKDQDLRDESKGRLDDATRFLGIATSLSKETTTSVVALTDIVKKWEKREEDQERLERALADRPQTPQAFTPQRLPSRKAVDDE